MPPTTETTFLPGEWQAVQDERERIMAVLTSMGAKIARRITREWRREVWMRIRREAAAVRPLDSELSNLLLAFARSRDDILLYARLPFCLEADRMVSTSDMIAIRGELGVTADALPDFVSFVVDAMPLSPAPSETPRSRNKTRPSSREPCRA